MNSEANIMDWLVYPVVFGIISSVFFAVGLWLYQQYRYFKTLRKRFHNTIYQSYHKRFPETAVQEVKLKVKGNLILFNGKRMSDNTPFTGQFIVNPINLKSAEGYQNHTDEEGFGFMNMIITSKDEFLVESPYTKMYLAKNEKTGVKNTNPSGVRMYQAFVWRRKD